MDSKNNCIEIDNSFYDGVGEITDNMKGCGLPVDEELIKEKFDNIHEKIINHDERISRIEIGMVQQQESMKYVIKNQEELSNDIKFMSNNLMQYNNSVLTSLNDLLRNKNDNNTKIKINKEENRNKLYIQLMILFGGLITGGITIYTTMVK